MKGLKVLKKDQWYFQVAFCFVFWVCELGQFHRPWLMRNDKLLQILKMMRFCWNFSKWWGFKQKNILIDVRIIVLVDVKLYILIQPLLLKVLHKDSLDICGLFWDVKMENWVFGIIQKTLDTKWALILEHNCKYIKNHPSIKLKK